MELNSETRAKITLLTILKPCHVNELYAKFFLVPMKLSISSLHVKYMF